MIIGETIERKGSTVTTTKYERKGDIITEHIEHLDANDRSYCCQTNVWRRQDLPTDTMRELAAQLIAQADILDGRKEG